MNAIPPSPSVRGERSPPSETAPLLQAANPTNVQETELSSGPPTAFPATATALTGFSKPSSVRQVAPDLLRGLLMAVMAIDHSSVTLGGYAHGTGVVSEKASTVITAWNEPLPYLLRTATHMCAPGFSMLLGMGMAYFTASRVRQGWSASRLMRHIFSRALAIISVNFFIQFVLFLSQGTWIWILNIVLWALAFDYVIVGFLSLLIVTFLEPFLAKTVFRIGFKDEQICYTTSSPDSGEESSIRPNRTCDLADTVAYHLVNALLLVLSAVILWANVWSSPNQGECRMVTTSSNTPGSALNIYTNQLRPLPSPADRCESPGKFIFDFLFQEVNCPQMSVVSAFPPIGWLSFVIFGLLYGRILLRTSARKTGITVFNSFLSVLFALLFVSTRFFGYGNLSTHCLNTPDQLALAQHANQYLNSLRSFLYATKYPPSPAFAFFTLSLNFAFIALFDIIVNLWSHFTTPLNPLLVYGNQPLFFYGAHMTFLQLLGLILMKTPLAHPLPSWSTTGRGIGLGWTFLFSYLSCLVSMYFICRAYGHWKITNGPNSIWRFL